MASFSRLADAADSLLDMFSGVFKDSIGDYCDIETADDEYTFVSKDGSLLTLLRVSGCRSLMDYSDLRSQIISPLVSSMTGQFNEPAHQLQFWFEVDPDATRTEVSRLLEPSRETARRLSLDLQDLIDNQVDSLSRWVHHEKAYIVLWTRPSAMHKSESKKEKVLRKETMTGFPSSSQTQDPLRATTMLRNRHKAFVGSFDSEIHRAGILATKLTVKEAAIAMRSSIDPGFTSEDWQVALPGDKITFPSSRKRKSSGEQWEVLSPPLSWQLCPRDAVQVGNNAVEIGDRVYSPIYIDLFARSPQTFQHLFAKANEKGIPWRVSFLMEGAGLSGTALAKALGGMLAFLSPGNNKLMSNSLKELQEFESEGLGVSVKLRTALCTWAPRGNMSLLSERSSNLARTVQNWGSCDVSEVTGDPLSGVMSTALAMTQGSIATKSSPPLSDALTLMPWTRPSMPWEHGSVLFRTPDGKVMPYNPVSGEQNTWISLIFASPGSGKSVLINILNRGLLLKSGNKRLPRIAVIDIGPSSSGFISLVKDALPAKDAHLAVHKRLQMTPDNAINPFDTMLGCRYPTPEHMAFLQNFLVLLATDINTTTPPDGMGGMVTAVIAEMYRDKADKGGSPNRYASNVEPIVDAALRLNRIEVDDSMIWWEVVDQLFLAGDYRAASLAQRHAVPLVQDAISIVQGDKINSRYGTTPASNSNELLVHAFSRQLTDALGVFTIISRPTRLDFASARIVALDLDEVARGGGAQGNRITAVMYMLARHVTTSEFYVNPDTVVSIPAPSDFELMTDTVPVQKYKEYHRQRIDDLFADPKRVCYDEFHLTSSSPTVREQVTLDCRVGRKFKVEVILGSQSLSDFDDMMIEVATCTYIMGGSTKEMILDNIRDKFSFDSNSEYMALRNHLKPPGPGGGVFMAKMETKSGRFSMLLSAPLGPIELWAFSTTPDDVALRNRLYAALGPSVARRALAEWFPGGSAAKEVENRKLKMRESSGHIIDGQSTDPVDDIYREIMDHMKG